MERRRPAPPEKPDIDEKGSPKEGQPQSSNRRLFMQLLAFTGAADTDQLTGTLKLNDIQGVLYEDVADPWGVALLTMSEDPDYFVTTVRPALHDSPYAKLTPRPELTMFGRTYSIGYEPDLEETLFTRPRRTAMNPDWPWAVWYPLRRSGRFNGLDADEQRSILMEHGTIGRAFGEHDFAHDIRLASHGLDRNDNDFVVGLTGKDLYPLSAIVQTMRKTRQTSEFLESLGPFFVGKVAWRSGE